VGRGPADDGGRDAARGHRRRGRDGVGGRDHPRDTRVAGLALVLATALAAGCDHGHKKTVTNGADAAVARWAQAERFADNPDAVAGARIFATSGCLACHTYLRRGSENLDAGDLTSVGRGQPRVAFFERYVRDPTRFGNRVMPKYDNLGAQRLHDLAVFLAASKGRR
jgi:hypothetical protein